MASDAASKLALLYARPGFLLRRAHQISVSIFESACQEVSLTPGQFAVLTLLRARPTLDQSGVARALGINKVTVSQLLRALEGRGLVHRKPHPENRRKRSLALTVAGLELLLASNDPTEAAYETLMSPFDPEQRERLIILLQQLIQHLGHCARTPLQTFE